MSSLITCICRTCQISEGNSPGGVQQQQCNTHFGLYLRCLEGEVVVSLSPTTQHALLHSSLCLYKAQAQEAQRVNSSYPKKANTIVPKAMVAICEHLVRIGHGRVPDTCRALSYTRYIVWNIHTLTNKLSKHKDSGSHVQSNPPQRC